MTQKYGRTYHLPSSPGVSSDDKVMPTLQHLYDADVVIATEKMDGENTTIHSGGCHARSIDSRHRPDQDWMKAFAAMVSPHLNEDERIIGEYLYARHSIAYDNLPSYFLGFAWILDGIIQPWDDTVDRFENLGIYHVQVLYRGMMADMVTDHLATNVVMANTSKLRMEGFVIRDAGAFPESDMPTHMGKWVRENHVQTDEHWTKKPIVRNRLKEN